MVNDLFIPTVSKEKQLENWMRDKRFFASHDVIKWGVDNFYNRADRTKRDLIEQGKVRLCTDFERFSYGYTCKDSVYKYIG
jgi:hypothetical protein